MSKIAPGAASGTGGNIVADMHQRVTSLKERGQALDTRIGELRKDIADLRVEPHTGVAELRTNIAAVRGDMVHRSEMADLRGDMSHLRNDMNQRFAAVDQKFTWLVGIQVAGLVAVIGALVGSHYR